MEHNNILGKVNAVRLTMVEIKKLPIEMQYRIKGAVDVLEIQKAQREKKKTA